MSNGVNIISEGVFEIDGKKKFFMNLRKKNSKILQYCNYLLLKEREENFKKSLLENLKVNHKKLTFSPINSKNFNTDREYSLNKNDNSLLIKRDFTNRHMNYKKISLNNNKHLTLDKIRYNSANFRMNDKNKTNTKNYNSFNDNRLILIPLGLKTFIKNKENENRKTIRKKYNKRLVFKNDTPFSNIYNINLMKPKRKENDMIFPKKFQNLKKKLIFKSLKTKNMLIKLEDLIYNEK